ncbi:hypothetical protein [Pararhizobium gei]|nr:hypothetical protein [Rhizobium gei]
MTIIMMLFFSGLTLDLSVPAAILLGMVALDRAALHIKSGWTMEVERA